MPAKMPTVISVNSSKTLGPVKFMNAVNNGPTKPRADQSKGNFETYKALKIPYARIHDANWSSAYGAPHTVDITAIFPNFDADPADPSNYDFAFTDYYIAQLEANGLKAYYRLGITIENHAEIKSYHTAPPKDYDKWARICEHIIAHYNEGWADGFHYNIEYWEIWNEPDCHIADGSNPCWQGSEAEFAEFFAVATGYLKEKFPHLKIGGPALASIRHDEVNEAHLCKIREYGVKPDFLSFHCYGKTVERFTESIDMARKAADKYRKQRHNGVEETVEIIEKHSG